MTYRLVLISSSNVIHSLHNVPSPVLPKPFVNFLGFESKCLGQFFPLLLGVILLDYQFFFKYSIQVWFDHIICFVFWFLIFLNLLLVDMFRFWKDIINIFRNVRWVLDFCWVFLDYIVDLLAVAVLDTLKAIYVCEFTGLAAVMLWYRGLLYCEWMASFAQEGDRHISFHYSRRLF